MRDTQYARSSKQLTSKYIPRTAKYKGFFLINVINIYNKLPNETKLKSRNVFNKLTKKWILNHDGVCDTGD